MEAKLAEEIGAKRLTKANMIFTYLNDRKENKHKNSTRQEGP